MQIKNGFLTPCKMHMPPCKRSMKHQEYKPGLWQLLHQVLKIPSYYDVSNITYRLSLESERERLGERLLERDLLCERLRGERDLKQPGHTLKSHSLQHYQHH